jgi:hypothetical protein
LRQVPGFLGTLNDNLRRIGQQVRHSLAPAS